MSKNCGHELTEILDSGESVDGSGCPGEPCRSLPDVRAEAHCHGARRRGVGETLGAFQVQRQHRPFRSRGHDRNDGDKQRGENLWVN